MRSLGVLAVAVVSLGLPAAAWTAEMTGPARWHVPVSVSAQGEHGRQAQVAMDGAGDAVVAWERSGDKNKLTDLVARAATRVAGGEFAARVDLSRPGSNVDALAPKVAIDAAGDAIAVWQRSIGLHRSFVQASVRRAGERFSAPVNLSAIGEDAGFAPQVAIDGIGDAIAVWGHRDMHGRSIVQASLRPAGRSFAKPIDISAAGHDAHFPRLAIDERGDAIIVWARYDGGGALEHSIVQAAVRSKSGGFSRPIDLSARGALFADVALNAAGTAIVVWHRLRRDGSDIVQATVRSASGGFAKPIALSVPGQDARYPEVAIDRTGDAIVVWERYDLTNPDGSIVQAATRPAGGAFSNAVSLSAPDQQSSSPALAMNEAGSAVVVWTRAVGARHAVGRRGIVEARVRPAGGDFSAAVTLSAAGQNARGSDVAIDRSGDAIAVWTQLDSTGGSAAVQAAAYDAATSASSATTAASWHGSGE